VSAPIKLKPPTIADRVDFEIENPEANLIVTHKDGKRFTIPVRFVAANVARRGEDEYGRPVYEINGSIIYGPAFAMDDEIKKEN
jgi:hypothetical protein